MTKLDMEKKYSRKEMLELTGKSIAGVAMLGAVPAILTGCGDDKEEQGEDAASVSSVEDQEVVYTPDEEACITEIKYEIKDGKIHDVAFEGGCVGNLEGIASLTEGMDPADAAERMKGIVCTTGGEAKSTSCPDQFSKSLEELL